jgi:hypothetical protein
MVADGAEPDKTDRRLGRASNPTHIFADYLVRGRPAAFAAPRGGIDRRQSSPAVSSAARFARRAGQNEWSRSMESARFEALTRRLASGASRRRAVGLLTGGAAAALGGAALSDAAAKGNANGNGNSNGNGNGNNSGSQSHGKNHHGSKGTRRHGGKSGHGAKSNNTKADAGTKTCLQPGAACGSGDRCCGQGHYCGVTASTLSDKKTVCCNAPGMACSADGDCCGGGSTCRNGFCAAA